jgi:hypothetical protein
MFSRPLELPWADFDAILMGLELKAPNAMHGDQTMRTRGDTSF